MIYIQSKTGGRSENQDFYGTAQTHFGELIVVCDGMGGHNGGRHAAEVAVQVIMDEVTNSEDSNPANALHAAIAKANAVIWDESHANSQLKGMGTTVVALLLTPEKAICAHVGDSRIYQLRKGKILHRTFDHSHVFELVKAGLITEEQARLSEKSNIITRGLGIRSTVDIEIRDNLSYQKGDRFLLCTDGICGAVPENELVELVSQKSKIETIVSQLVDKIDEIGKTNGGNHDNLTAAMIEVDTNSTLTQPKPQKKKKSSLIYLILLVMLAVLSTTIFFLNKGKQIKQPIEKTKVIKEKTAPNP
jgi:PPM family protein phosphatase